MGAASCSLKGVSFHVHGHLVLGDRLYLGRDSRIVRFQHVVVGEDVRFAERVSVHDETHAYEPVPKLDSARDTYNYVPVQIGARVWLAINVVVAEGTVIGDDTVVAAGSVVTKVLPAGVLAGGAPAVILRRFAERRGVQDPHGSIRGRDRRLPD